MPVSSILKNLGKLINREFIHPVAVEPYYTQTMSFIDHFMILPVALMNISLDHVTISRRNATWLFYLAFVAYTVFIYHIHSVTGRWVYPFMNHLGFYHVTMYFLPTLCILGIFVVKLSFAINNHFTKPKAKSNWGITCSIEKVSKLSKHFRSKRWYRLYLP